MQSKCNSYIGFAVRKNSVVYGLDSLSQYRKKVFLVLCSDTLNSNSLEKSHYEASRRNIPLLIVPQLENVLQKNCKVLSICDKNLTNAIILQYKGNSSEVNNENN